ncbi:MAG: hypothetical protein C5B57_07115 [Blastocatellia bacterium]|nr:MAG: hypothetical protein C5B57_07115 [Blastocatellia bacterium]
MPHRTSIGAMVLSLFVLGLPCLPRADEGMWVYNNVPKAEIKKRYDVDISDAWLDHVRLASVRFNSGGSGSFVSPDGLVITNHHIASDVLSKISTADHNYFKTGFYAQTRDAEVKAPDLELNVLESIEDVTARVNAAVTADMDRAAGNTARRAAMADIEKESLGATGLRSDVVTLYRGGQYHLYRYKKYTDVRLVFAPEFDVAFFGGDPDNFNYPRFDLDMAIFRIYEDGKPATIAHYLKWSKTGVREGDLVFVSGSPGSTSRLNTVDHLEFLRDVQYPFNRRRLARLHDVLLAYARQGSEAERQAHDEIFSVENSIKVISGEYRGLTNSALLGRKRAAEVKLRKTVNADPRMSRAYGDAWDTVSKTRSAFRAYYIPYRLVEGGVGFSSTYFDLARTLVRLGDESAKVNAQRLREYTEASRSSLELRLFSPAPIYNGLEEATLTEGFAFMRDELGADNATVKTVLAGKAARERAAELIRSTRLADVEYRRRIAAGGAKAVAESTDPMIVLARQVDPESRALRTRFENEIQAAEEIAYGKIARALYEVEGARLYPDATFTLRLAFGAVKGYEENGRPVAAFTTLGGLFERAAKSGNAEPNHLPERWLEKRSALDLATPMNFVTTSDTIGGNSGSPLVNRDGEFVGLNFDRNSHGLVRSFVYDELRARNIAVDVRAMAEALRKIYGAAALLDDLTR